MPKKAEPGPAQPQFENLKGVRFVQGVFNSRLTLSSGLTYPFLDSRRKMVKAILPV